MNKIDITEYFLVKEEEKEIMLSNLKDFLFKITPYNIDGNEEALNFINDTFAVAKHSYVEMGFMDSSINDKDIIIKKHESVNNDIEFYISE